MLTTAQVSKALLVKGDLGPKFVKTTTDELAFAARTRLKMPLVQSSVASFKTTKAATVAVDNIAKIADTCKMVRTRTGDGGKLELSLTHDELPLAPEAHQQFNLHVTGSMAIQGLTLPMSMEVSVVRIGRNVVFVMMLDMKTNVGSAGLLKGYDLVTVSDFR